MATHTKLTVLGAVLAAFLTSACADLDATGRPPPPPPPPPQLPFACNTGQWPPGWIKVDHRWDPMLCGSPSNYVPNVARLERFDDKPVGHVMFACVLEPVPNGWEELNQFSNTQCRLGGVEKNMMTIRRLR